MAKKVKIEIKNSKVKMDFSGFSGQECERVAERVNPPELVVEEKEYKEEYYQVELSANSESEREMQ